MAIAVLLSVGALAFAEPGVPLRLEDETIAAEDDLGRDEAAGRVEEDAAGDIENQKIFTGDGEPTSQESDQMRPPYLDMARLAASLAAVLGLVVAGAWAFKRFAPRTAGMFGSGTLKVLARTYLGPKQMVSLVSVPGRLLVVGSTQQSVSTLAEITDPAEMERVLTVFERNSPKSASEAFKNIMATVTGREGAKNEMEEELVRTVENVSERVARLSNRLEAYDEEVS